MIEFIDPFGKQVLVECVTSPHKNRIGLIIRRERQVIYESLELDTAKHLVEELMAVIKEKENAE